MERGVGQARSPADVGQVQQAARPGGQPREQGRHRGQLLDMRQVPNVPLEHRRDVGGEPPASAPLRTAICLGVAAAEHPARDVGPAGRARSLGDPVAEDCIEESFAPPLDLALGQGVEREKLQATGQGVGHPRYGEHVRRSGPD